MLETSKKLTRSLNYVYLYLLVNYGSLIISSLIYSAIFGEDSLASFITKEGLYLNIFINICFLGFLLIKKPREKLKTNNWLIAIPLGISLGFILNFITSPFALEKNLITTVPIIVLLLTTCVIGPIIEEIIFRKITLGRLLEFNSKWVSIIIMSLIFAIIHGSIPGMILGFILSVVLAYIYNLNKNLLEIWIIHGFVNLIGFYYYNIIALTGALIPFVCAILIFVIIIKRYYFNR